MSQWTAEAVGVQQVLSQACALMVVVHMFEDDVPEEVRLVASGMKSVIGEHFPELARSLERFLASP